MNIITIAGGWIAAAAVLALIIGQVCRLNPLVEGV
jgi:hypothetical protein